MLVRISTELNLSEHIADFLKSKTHNYATNLTDISYILAHKKSEIECCECCENEFWTTSTLILFFKGGQPFIEEITEIFQYEDNNLESTLEILSAFSHGNDRTLAYLDHRLTHMLKTGEHYDIDDLSELKQLRRAFQSILTQIRSYLPENKIALLHAGASDEIVDLIEHVTPDWFSWVLIGGMDSFNCYGVEEVLCLRYLEGALTLSAFRKSCLHVSNGSYTPISYIKAISESLEISIEYDFCDITVGEKNIVKFLKDKYDIPCLCKFEEELTALKEIAQ